MRLLFSLLGAQSEAIDLALGLGQRLVSRGHQITFLGSFSDSQKKEIVGVGAHIVEQLKQNDISYDAMLLGSLAMPEKMAALAQKLPTVLLVKEGMLDLMMLKGDFYHWVNLFRACKYIVFMTEDQRDKVFASFISSIDTARIIVCPAGVPATLFGSKNASSRDYLNVVMAAPLISHKRQQDLIATGEKLRDFNLVFSFIGEKRTEQFLPDGLKKVVERNPERYIFTGVKTQSEVYELLKDSDIYCHTSGDESWPLAVMQAAAVGLPLLLSDIKPLSQLWLNGVNCLKFPVGKTDYLASIFRLILQDDILRSNLVTAAQLTARRFSEDRFYNQILPLVESLKR